MKLSFLNLIIIVFGTFAISRVVLRFKGKEISLSATIFWLFVWTAVLSAILFPNLTVELASLIGVGRGADSAFLISILILFYLIFRLYVKLDKIDRDITELSIKISKKFHSESKLKK